MMSLQPGDVLETYAEVDALSQTVDFAPKKSLEDGLQSFVDWYQQYHEQSQSSSLAIFDFVH